MPYFGPKYHLEPGLLDELEQPLGRGGRRLVVGNEARLLVGERHHVGRIDAGRVGGAQDRLDEPARDAHTPEAEQLIGIAVARESAGTEGRLLLARRAVVAGRELVRESERRLMDRREVERQARLGRGWNSRRAG